MIAVNKEAASVVDRAGGEVESLEPERRQKRSNLGELQWCTSNLCSLLLALGWLDC